jgi:hypothetical protein
MQTAHMALAGFLSMATASAQWSCGSTGLLFAPQLQLHSVDWVQASRQTGALKEASTARRAL